MDPDTPYPERIGGGGGRGGRNATKSVTRQIPRHRNEASPVRTDTQTHYTPWGSRPTSPPGDELPCRFSLGFARPAAAQRDEPREGRTAALHPLPCIHVPASQREGCGQPGRLGSQASLPLAAGKGRQAPGSGCSVPAAQRGRAGRASRFPGGGRVHPGAETPRRSLASER